MRKLALLGAIFLGLGGAAEAHSFTAGGELLHAHNQAAHYWWPAMDNCTITTGVRRNGSFQAIPFIQCTATTAHYGSTPAPPMVGVPLDSPAAQQAASNYCPLKPGPYHYCHAPATPMANIGPDYQGN